MQAITPYLNFNGDAAAALALYARALKGQVVTQSTFADGPQPCDESMKDKILHAVFQSGELMLMVSDCPPGVSVSSGSNTWLSLNFAEAAELDNTFAALAEGGKITMEPQDTFWGARFAMLTDRFGVNWMFNHDKEPKP